MIILTNEKAKTLLKQVTLFETIFYFQLRPVQSRAFEQNTEEFSLVTY